MWLQRPVRRKFNLFGSTNFYGLLLLINGSIIYYRPLISIIYLQNTTSVVGNTTLLVLELLFEVSSLINTLYRFAVIQLLFKYQQKSLPFGELITLSLCDNNNCYNLLYRHETSNLDVTEEIFTLLTINNLNDVESSGLIDFIDYELLDSYP